MIYAWARDAPMLTLPPDVGFQIGKNTAIKYLVLQVHYATVDKFAGIIFWRLSCEFLIIFFFQMAQQITQEYFYIIQKLRKYFMNWIFLCSNYVFLGVKN